MAEEEREKCPECDSYLFLQQTYRGDALPPEDVAYCYGCGYTESI